MKIIENLEMVEELVTSPNAAMQKSPHKTNDEGESRNPMQLKESIDDNLITKGKNLHGHEISSQTSPAWCVWPNCFLHCDGFSSTLVTTKLTLVELKSDNAYPKIPQISLAKIKK